MNNPFNGLLFSDIVAYIHNNKVYCVLCVDELNIDKKFPLHSFVRVNKTQYCEGCKAELSLKKSEWKCNECNTINQHQKVLCEGCSNMKPKQL